MATRDERLAALRFRRELAKRECTCCGKRHSYSNKSALCPECRRKLPTIVAGVEVTSLPTDVPIEVDGGLWETLMSKDPDDHRLWEFDLRRRRVILIGGA
jgi:hypothetical protein